MQFTDSVRKTITPGAHSVAIAEDPGVRGEGRLALRGGIKKR
jgi:hypothetical protein